MQVAAIAAEANNPMRARRAESMGQVAKVDQKARVVAAFLLVMALAAGCTNSGEPTPTARDGTVAITVSLPKTTMDIASLQTVAAVAKDDKGATVQAQATLAFESSDPGVVTFLDAVG